MSITVSIKIQYEIPALLKSVQFFILKRNRISPFIYSRIFGCSVEGQERKNLCEHFGNYPAFRYIHFICNCCLVLFFPLPPLFSICAGRNGMFIKIKYFKLCSCYLLLSESQYRHIFPRFPHPRPFYLVLALHGRPLWAQVRKEPDLLTKMSQFFFSAQVMVWLYSLISSLLEIGC